MSTIVTRSGKGSPLTNTEVDANFTNLNTDKAELSGANFTGSIDVTGSVTADGLTVSNGTNTTAIPATSDRVSFTANSSYIQSTGSFYVQPTGDLVLNGTGSEIMRLKSSKVGINNSNPATALDVTGTITADGLTVYVASGGATATAATFNNGGSGANTKARLDFLAASTRYAGISGGYGASSPEMSFDISGTDVLAIKSTGIHVTGSVVADGLTVDGNAQLNGDLTVFDGTGDPFVKLQTSEQQYVLRIDNSQSDVFQIRDVTNSANRLAIANNGDISFYNDSAAQGLFWDSSTSRLGLGVTNPAVPLDVNGDIYARSGAVFADEFKAYSGVLTTYGSNTSALHYFKGSVGIGTNSPSQDIEILNGTTGSGIRLAATATAYWDIERDPTSGHLTFTDDGAGTVLTLGQDGSSVFSGSVSATSGNYTTSGTASLADGTNGLRIVREGGDGAGALGNGITFAQRWWSNSTQNVRTGAIFGKKINGSGSYGGGLAFYSQPASDADMVEALSIDSSQRVNIGSSLMVGSTTAPSYPLEVQSGGVGTVLRAGTSFVSIDSVGSASSPSLILNGDDNTGIWHPASDTLAVSTGGTERMRISNDGSCRWTPDGTNHDMTLTASGDLLVGTTSSSSNTAGIKLSSAGTASFVRSGVQPVYVNRLTNDGDLAVFAKNGTTVGSIGTSLTRLTIGSDDAMLLFDAGSTNAIWPWTSTATSDGDADNTIDIGDTTNRFKDLYLSSGVYLGGTGAANKLDDYEEGTWTPSLVGSTTAGTATFVTGPTGTYTKIGNQVTIYFDWNISAHTGAGALRVNGLPFTQTGVAVGAIMSGNYAFPASRPSLVAYGTGAVMRFYGTGSGVGYVENTLDVSHQINGSLTYRV